MPETPRSSFWKWWVCGVLLLATFLNYADRQTLAVSLPELKQRFHIEEARVGMLEGYFGFAFAAGSVLFGFLADRIGPRRLYPAVLVGWSAAGIATVFAGFPELTRHLQSPDDSPGTGPFRWLLICRTLLGFCEAGHWPCALITARQILLAKDRPLGNGLLQSGASLGAVLIPIYAEIVERNGAEWNFAFWSVGVLGLLWVPLWFALVRKSDFADPPPPAAIESESVDAFTFARRLFVLAVVVSCLNVSWQFLRAWLPLFLQDFHQIPRESTRFIVVAFFLASDAGCVLAGLLVKLLASRGWDVDAARRVGFFVFALLSACAAIVPFAGDGWLMVGLLIIAGMGVLGLHPYYYAFAQDLPQRRMGLYSGGLAATAWVVASQFQITIGAEIQRSKSYDVGLVIGGLAPAVGLAALLFVWPKKQHG